MSNESDVLRLEWEAAADRAWDNLRRYKFSNFGYYASRVVFLGQLIEKVDGKRPPNPFKDLALFARASTTKEVK